MKKKKLHLDIKYCNVSIKIYTLFLQKMFYSLAIVDKIIYFYIEFTYNFITFAFIVNIK